MVSVFFKKIRDGLNSLKNPPQLKRFIEHNVRVFSGRSNSKNNSVVLLELNPMHSAHIAYGYLASVLSEQSGARILGFSRRTHQNFVQAVLFRLRAALRRAEFGVYRSFGVDGFISISLSPTQKRIARETFEVVISGLRNTRDVEELLLNGVWVGDLVYDSFLMTYKQPTIDINSKDFRASLLESVEHFVFWDSYFDRHDVRGVNASHCVYNLAIPLRIAVKRGVPAFQAGITHVYRINQNNLFAYNDFHYFPKKFLSLPASVREAGVLEAKRRIDRRFAGEIGVDMAYSSKSAYGEKRHDRLIRESSRPKVLIATHCFFDSPHSYGCNLFPDFYEWLDFLGSISRVTDYDWYIKTHPDYLAGTMEIIQGFVAKYEKFTLLPSDASHHQIISESIDLALTTYGTIAFEYAALGIPVINASVNNPHIAYEFNMHARDVDDYRRLLLKINEIDFVIDRNQVYEYYFMRHIYNTENLFFNDYDQVVENLGGYSEQFTPKVYEKWIDEFSSDKHNALLKALRVFVESGDFRMDYSHYGKEITAESFGVK